jgi:hypothetical protein
MTPLTRPLLSDSNLKTLICLFSYYFGFSRPLTSLVDSTHSGNLWGVSLPSFRVSKFGGEQA